MYGNIYVLLGFDGAIFQRLHFLYWWCWWWWLTSTFPPAMMMMTTILVILLRLGRKHHNHASCICYIKPVCFTETALEKPGWLHLLELATFSLTTMASSLPILFLTLLAITITMTTTTTISTTISTTICIYNTSSHPLALSLHPQPQWYPLPYRQPPRAPCCPSPGQQSPQPHLTWGAKRVKKGALGSNLHPFRCNPAFFFTNEQTKSRQEQAALWLVGYLIQP